MLGVGVMGGVAYALVRNVINENKVFLQKSAVFKQIEEQLREQLQNKGVALNESQEAEKELRQKESNLRVVVGKLQEKSMLADQSKIEKQDQIDELQQKLAISQTEIEQLKCKEQERKAETEKALFALRKETEKVKEIKEVFEMLKKQMKDEFKVVSESVMKQRQASLEVENKKVLGALLNPLETKLEDFQKRINEVHDADTKRNSALEQELKKMQSLNSIMADEASHLTKALKGDSQQRGAWGEAQLERTLELSGLVKGEHYKSQESFKDENGKIKRTDYLIMLPRNKHMIIDSKVSLIDYEHAVAAQQTVKSDDEWKFAMQAHVKSVRRYIDELASKNYNNLAEIHSPEFVLMFMPIEPSFIEAIKFDKELFNYGFNKSVILVSHTTLIPILRTVANFWMLENSHQKARELGEKAGDIYDCVRRMAEHLKKMGESLKAVGGHYNKAVTSLSGRQGLHGKVERFNQLTSKVNQDIPEVNTHNFEFEISKLEGAGVDDRL